MKLYTGKNRLENWLIDSRLSGAFRVVNQLGIPAAKHLHTISADDEELQQFARTITLVRKTQWWHPKTIYETSQTEVGQAWLSLW